MDFEQTFVLLIFALMKVALNLKKTNTFLYFIYSI